MKYEKEAKDIIESFKKSVSAPYLSDDENAVIAEVAIRKSGMTVEKLSSDIEAGVKNGYSVEVQVKMIKKLLGVNK
jgi:hypothetical protein